MKLFALIAATTTATPVEGSCEPQHGWNCMYPHHKHGAVCFKACAHNSSGKHEQNAYQECHCKSHNNCQWVQLSHCHHPHSTEAPVAEEPEAVDTDPVFSAIDSMFNVDDVVELAPEEGHHHKKHHGHHNGGEMANDAVSVEEVVEEVEEIEEVEETTTEAPTEAPTTTTQAPTTTTVSLTNCHKPKHHWDCTDKHYTDGVSCKRECFKGAGYGLGLDMERQQTCTCGENGCFWIVTSDCSKFHNNVFKAELATFNAKNQKSCERKSSEWNCSHDYIHTQGTLCVRECEAGYELSLDFHEVSECQCHHDECNWVDLSSCERSG